MNSHVSCPPGNTCEAPLRVWGISGRPRGDFGATSGRLRGDLGSIEDLGKHLGDVFGTLEVLRRHYKQGLNFSDTHTYIHTQIILVIRCGNAKVLISGTNYHLFKKVFLPKIIYSVRYSTMMYRIVC